MKIDILSAHLNGKPHKWYDLDKDCDGKIPFNGVVAFKALYKTHPTYAKLVRERLHKKMNRVKKK